MSSALDNLTVTVETAVDRPTAERYLELYLTTFGPLETRAVARQVLHRDEFLEEMTDPRVLKYVAWSGGEAIGLSTLTRHLETVPWISPAWFRHHHPDHAARGAIYYIGFTLVLPEHRRGGAFVAMIDAIGAVLAREQAVVGWDICAHNDDDRGFGAHASRTLGRSGEVTVVPVDRQTYYVGTFAPPGPTGPGLAGGLG